MESANVVVDDGCLENANTKEDDENNVKIVDHSTPNEEKSTSIASPSTPDLMSSPSSNMENGSTNDKDNSEIQSNETQSTSDLVLPKEPSSRVKKNHPLETVIG